MCSSFPLSRCRHERRCSFTQVDYYVELRKAMAEGRLPRKDPSLLASAIIQATSVRFDLAKINAKDPLLDSKAGAFPSFGGSCCIDA